MSRDFLSGSALSVLGPSLELPAERRSYSILTQNLDQFFGGRSRRGEILRLRWQDVDFKGNKIDVVSGTGGHTKNYESRVIPMNGFLRDVLRKHPRRLDSTYVFFAPNGQPFADVDTSFATALRRSGLQHFRFHDLRHTFASWLVMGGVDLRTVQELLGHKDIRMTMRYSHLAPDHMRNAVAILDGGAVDVSAKTQNILDSHYLDTTGQNKENQDATCQANTLIFPSFSGRRERI